MSKASSPASEAERRLQEVLAEYIEAVEAGLKPERAALIARHPDLADELNEFFDNQDVLAPLDGLAEINALPSTRLTAQGPPTHFGDYEILSEIARGGMGVVYRARQISLNREVALKMILTDKATTSNTLRRFQIEAEAAAHLDHPNIVPIYEVSEIDGQAYFTMKLVEGGCLSARLAELRLPAPGTNRREIERQLGRLVELTATVARAVHHAHQRGILHRDLKPGNILLDGEDRPMVTDFGLAKRVGRDGDLTQLGTIIGTAAYMAPEQARPNREGLTLAADVYSLGAIFYELLTGRPPIRGDSQIDTLLRVAKEKPVPPRQRNPNVPPDLDAICLKCLQKEPGRRYGSALELAEDLERWQAGDAISLRTPTTVERAWRWARRNRLSAALLAAVALLMVVVTVGSLLAAWRIATARDRADANAVRADENAAQAKENAEKAETNATQAESNAAEAALNAAKERSCAPTPTSPVTWPRRPVKRPKRRAPRIIVCSCPATWPMARAPSTAAICSAPWSGTARPWTATAATRPARTPTVFVSPLCCAAVPGWCRSGSTTIPLCRRPSAPTAGESCCSARTWPASGT